MISKEPIRHVRNSISFRSVVNFENEGEITVKSIRNDALRGSQVKTYETSEFEVVEPGALKENISND